MATRSRSEVAPADRPVARVGFIGLGDMGGAMARRVIERGWPTVLWARRREALEAFDAPNVDTAVTAAALAASVDLVGVCVWADDDVRAVVAGVDGVLAGCRAGTIIAVHSTVQPETCRQLAAAAAAKGVVLIDAPVSGGRTAALAGALCVAVGGDARALERIRAVLESFASEIVYFGAVGSGQVAKLLNNALLAANLAVADDALTLGEDLGLDPADLEAFLRSGSGRSFGLDVAVASRSSAEARKATATAIQKDLRSLVGTLPGGTRPPLIEAGSAAIRRLSHPPPGWR